MRDCQPKIGPEWLDERIGHGETLNAVVNLGAGVMIVMHSAAESRAATLMT